MNPWAIQSLVSAIGCLSVGIYVFYKNPKKPVNRVFALLMVSACIWGIGEFGSRTGLGMIPVIRDTIAPFGWCFISALALHLCIIFSKVILNKLVYLALYAPSFVILYLQLTTDLIFKHTLEEKYWGFRTPPGDLILVYFIYVILYTFVAVYLCYKRAFKTNVPTEKKQCYFVGTALFLPVIISITTNLLAPLLRIDVVELGVGSVLIGAAIFTYAIAKYKLFIIEPKAEEVIETPQKYPLERGLAYLTKEEKLDKSYEIFYDQVAHGYSGLVITKLPPDTVRERYKIAKSPILWLTFKTNIENAISPKDIEGVKSAVSDFVGRAQKPVILLDCFDQLMLANGLEKAKGLLKEVKDLCMKNNTNLLLSINPEMLEKEQLSVLEKELEAVK